MTEATTFTPEQEEEIDEARQNIRFGADVLRFARNDLQMTLEDAIALLTSSPSGFNMGESADILFKSRVLKTVASHKGGTLKLVLDIDGNTFETTI